MADVKACGNTYCERTLSARSVFKLCARCRNYDKRAAARTPSWSRSRHATLCRWDVLLINAAPKNTFKNADALEFDVVQPTRKRQNNVTQIRKRA
jgi:hypothetical protein